MVRRPTQNETGIDRIPLENSNVHDAWAVYICVNCRAINYVHIGNSLVSPEYAYENYAWECTACGFVHSKNADLHSGRLFFGLVRRIQKPIGSNAMYVAGYFLIMLLASTKVLAHWKSKWNVGLAKVL